MKLKNLTALMIFLSFNLLMVPTNAQPKKPEQSSASSPFKIAQAGKIQKLKACISSCAQQRTNCYRQRRQTSCNQQHAQCVINCQSLLN